MRSLWRLRAIGANFFRWHAEVLSWSEQRLGIPLVTPHGLEMDIRENSPQNLITEVNWMLYRSECSEKLSLLSRIVSVKSFPVGQKNSVGNPLWIGVIDGAALFGGLIFNNSTAVCVLWLPIILSRLIIGSVQHSKHSLQTRELQQSDSTTVQFE